MSKVLKPIFKSITMKNLILFLAVLLGTQANAQVKALEGVELNYYKPGVHDFTIEKLNDSDSADHFAYSLLVDLNNECINSTRVPRDKDGEINFGYIFHFEEYDVWYLCLYGGTIKGSLQKR
jgi:hypothetical protein